MSRKRAPAEEQDIAPRRREQNERTEDGDPRTHPPSNEVTSTKTRTTIPYLFRVFNFLRFCEVEAAIYFAFSFFVAMRGIETTAILTNRSTRNPIGEAIGSLQYLRCVALIPQPAYRCAFSTGMQSPAQFHYRRCRQLASMRVSAALRLNPMECPNSTKSARSTASSRFFSPAYKPMAVVSSG